MNVDELRKRLVEVEAHRDELQDQLDFERKMNNLLRENLKRSVATIERFMAEQKNA